MDIKRFLIIVGLLAAAVTGIRMGTQHPGKDDQNAKPIVSVSTFALYEAARSVAGEDLQVRPIIPFGTDAHIFSPDPKKVAEISRSALFVYNGAGFESWAESLKNTLSSQTEAIDMSAHVKLIREVPGMEEEHNHGAYDPHYWLDIDNMIVITRTLEEEFSRRFPQDSEHFHKNGAIYVAKLQQLRNEYTAGLKECKNRVLVSNHDAFGYLAQSNGLKNISVIGLSSDEQPSAKNIADIITLVRAHHIKTIFFEEFINDNVSQTIARETSAEAESLQPLENISEDELHSRQTYLSIMRDNLAKLKNAMECR